tara:strand:+ start:25892 stop:26197 length:306 start_codon:yes stop_codon:yes gene_type:complete
MENTTQKINDKCTIHSVLNSAVVWDTLENFDASTTLAQHAFVSVQRGKYYEDKYDGNKSLCGKIGAHDGDKFIALKDFNPEVLNEEKACKTCLKIYKKGII